MVILYQSLSVKCLISKCIVTSCLMLRNFDIVLNVPAEAKYRLDVKKLHYPIRRFHDQKKKKLSSKLSIVWFFKRKVFLSNILDKI